MNADVISIDLPNNLPFTIQIHRISHFHKHWHQAVELFFVLKGTVEVDLQGSVSHLKEGDLLLINRNQIHELRSDGHAWR